MADIRDVIVILEKMDSRLDNIDVTLAKQAKDLEYHIKRTDLLESKLAPIEQQSLFIKTGIKLIGYAAAAIGFIVSIYETTKK